MFDSDFFIKKDAGAENDNSCLTTSSLADNGKQVFVGIEQVGTQTKAFYNVVPIKTITT